MIIDLLKVASKLNMNVMILEFGVLLFAIRIFIIITFLLNERRTDY